MEFKLFYFLYKTIQNLFIKYVFLNIYFNRYGRKVTILGKQVTKIKVIINGIKNGITAFVTLSNDIFAILEVTYNNMPTGGEFLMD